MKTLLPLLAVLLCAVNAHAAQDKKRPNVLFLLSDDQRADTIGALGNQHIKTPNLDRLVRNGFVFNRAYCMGSHVPAVCLPSRTMIVTGRTLFRIQQTPDIPIFPQVMNLAGYVTFRTGKNSNVPMFANAKFQTNKNLPRTPTCSEEHAEDAIKFLRGLKGDQPFFLMVAFGHPHDPRKAPPKYMKQYRPGDVPMPANYLPVHPFDNGEMTIRDEKLAPWPRTKEEMQTQLAEYYAVITYMDHEIGRILQTLEETGQLDNTIIIFSSDHGLALGSHGLMGKQNLYDHSMRAPLVFSGPGIPKGKASDAFAYLFDIFPTVCDLAGIETPRNVEGKSLAPIMRGTAQRVRDSIFLAYRPQRAVMREDGWKLIRYTHINRNQLFNLKDDPEETKDLASDVKYAPRIEELTTLLRTWQQELGDKLALVSAQPKDERFTPPK